MGKINPRTGTMRERSLLKKWRFQIDVFQLYHCADLGISGRTLEYVALIYLGDFTQHSAQKRNLNAPGTGCSSHRI